MTLTEAKIGDVMEIEAVRGERSFRRRLLELGLVPGTQVTYLGVAPLGDPLHLLVRGCQLSIRRAEASQVSVRMARASDLAVPVVPSAAVSA